MTNILIRYLSCTVEYHRIKAQKAGRLEIHPRSCALFTNKGGENPSDSSSAGLKILKQEESISHRKQFNFPYSGADQEK